ncbi:hypothetical protein INT47_003527 [Mucor saturninus]|uniref:peptidylprolyl isomerase n=1 Tax=Mucor saturninus TaxID=64648 RepID=A0A8H7UZJ7_9FUNG|nr:hypothetical protein INT47_003527 [Mucor saturninus]
MLFSNIFKLSALITLVATVYANNEADLEQPTKLLGGVLKRPEKCGFKVSSNSEVLYHYRARVWGEDEFYENTYEGEPLKVKFGRDKIMKGLEQGMHGMCEGEVRRLLIPAEYAYGEIGLPHLVPGNTAVIYEVEVVDVNSPFSNPWFWTGLSFMAFVYVYYGRLQKFLTKSDSSDYLKNKAAEKKSE